jgi:RNase P subunit RPR2
MPADWCGEANVEEASTMIVQSACRSASLRVLATEDLSRPKCPDCSSILLIAEESRFYLRGRIDHAWSCDACGSAFVTSIRLRRREPARQDDAYSSDPVE